MVATALLCKHEFTFHRLFYLLLHYSACQSDLTVNVFCIEGLHIQRLKFTVTVLCILLHAHFTLHVQCIRPVCIYISRKNILMELQRQDAYTY